MKRTALEVISLEGTPVEIAYQLGRKRAFAIPSRMEFWDRDLALLYRGRKKNLLRDLEKAFLKEAIKQKPDYVEEIRAMSEGAGVRFEDLFRLNLTELNTPYEKCTTLAFPVRDAGGSGVLLAHNEDWNPQRNDVFVLKAKLPDVSYLVLTYDGYLPGLSCGFNSHGLYHAVNYLRPPDFRVGLARIFVTHFLLTARSIPEVLRWTRDQKRAFGQSIHLAQGEHYINLELTAKQRFLRRPKLPAAHANHYLTPMAARRCPASGSTANRQRIAQEKLNEMKKRKKTSWTLGQAKREAGLILSDRSGFPFALWRKADHPEETSATLACTLLYTQSDHLEAHRHPPSEERKSLRIKL